MTSYVLTFLAGAAAMGVSGTILVFMLAHMNEGWKQDQIDIKEWEH